MKKLIRLTVSLVGAGLLALTGLTTLAHAQDRGETKATIGKANVSVEYGRPSLKGRDPLKMIQPGAIWRVGSNAATTLTTDADLDFGGTPVAKGKHILLARVAEPGKWSLVVSSKSAFQYEPSAKIAEVPLELGEAKDSVEELTLTLSGKNGKGTLEIAWGTLRLIGTFAVAK